MSQFVNVTIDFVELCFDNYCFLYNTCNKEYDRTGYHWNFREDELREELPDEPSYSTGNLYC